MAWKEPSELAAYGAMLHVAEKYDLYRGVATHEDVQVEGPYTGSVHGSVVDSHADSQQSSMHQQSRAESAAANATDAAMHEERKTGRQVVSDKNI